MSLTTEMLISRDERLRGTKPSIVPYSLYMDPNLDDLSTTKMKLSRDLNQLMLKNEQMDCT
jgi:hypothetical protein